MAAPPSFFAQKLADHCSPDLEIRLGVATGIVAVVKDNFPWVLEFSAQTSSPVFRRTGDLRELCLLDRTFRQREKALACDTRRERPRRTAADPWLRPAGCASLSAPRTAREPSLREWLKWCLKP